MRVTKGWVKCTLKIADKVERESETIRKVCDGRRVGGGVEKIFSRH